VIGEVVARTRWRQSLVVGKEVIKELSKSRGDGICGSFDNFSLAVRIDLTLFPGRVPQISCPNSKKIFTGMLN
jgi:hypothetical protein